ncbi:Phosphocarrier protein HPr [bioreactor metagenome]|uniref:Phosphocarrier protein HPr n=1 Tax=bioreactor metagenome TaxID=1076179 RepID=A0A645FDZ4_9ZZZZ
MGFSPCRPSLETEKHMQTNSVIVKCKCGLHARPAACVMKAAKAYQSKVRITKGDKSGNAKSIIDILSINVNCMDRVDVSCEGEDETEAMQAVLAILESEIE